MMIRRFLETDDVFDVPDDPAMTPDDRPPLRGIALPREVLERSTPRTSAASSATARGRCARDGDNCAKRCHPGGA